MDTAVLSDTTESIYRDGHFSETAAPLPGIPRGKSKKGRIFILVDVEGGTSAPSGDKLRQSIVDTFYRDPSRSLTSTLRRILQTLNESIVLENERSIRSDRTFASIACAVLRDDDIYIALAGRALCFCVSSSGCERLGRSDPESSDRTVDRLGQTADIGVDLYYRAAASMSSIILASSTIVDLGEGNLEAVLVSHPNEAATILRELGDKHEGHRNFRTLAIGTRSLPQVSSHPKNPASRFDRPRRHLDYPPGEAADDLSTVGVTPRARFSNDAIVAPSLDEPHRESRSHAVSTAASAARRVMLALPVASRRFFRLRTRLTPEIGRGVALVAIILALFGVGYLAATTAAQLIRSGTVYANAVSELSQAEQRERDGLAATDPLARRGALGDAKQLATTALKDRPASTAAAAALARIQREWDDATSATRLGPAEHVVDLPSTADQLVLNGNDLAVLDRRGSEVYLYMLNVDGSAVQAGNSPVLVRRGDHVGPVTIGNVTSIAWMPAGGSRTTPAWIMLDAAGFLVQYVPTTGLSLLALTQLDPWTDTTAIAGSGGNLFVLNAKKQAITWYQPQPSGYDGTPHSYLTSNDGASLAEATNVVVKDDVFVSHVNGRLDRFRDGKPIELPPLPVDLAPTGSNGFAVGTNALYLGDGKRERIIQLSAGGDFQRAFNVAEPGLLAGMRDLALSDDGRYLYVLAGSSIYRFSLPNGT